MHQFASLILILFQRLKCLKLRAESMIHKKRKVCYKDTGTSFILIYTYMNNKGKNEENYSCIKVTEDRSSAHMDLR